MALSPLSSTDPLHTKPEKPDAEITPVTANTMASPLASAANSFTVSEPPSPSLAGAPPASAPASASVAAQGTAPASSPLENPISNPNFPNPNTTFYSNMSTGVNPTAAVISPPAPLAVPSFTPSFRPLGAPSMNQYTTVHNPNIQPPGVAAPSVSFNPMMQVSMYPAPPGMSLTSAHLSYGSNGYISIPAPAPHVIPPPAPSFGFCRE